MSPGTFATHSEWSTVCLSEIAFSLGRVVLLLHIQNGLQCVSVKCSSLFRSSGTLATHSEWPTVCLGEIAISLGRL